MDRAYRLIILGAGGYGRTIADIAAQLGYSVFFLDDNSDGSAVIGKCADYREYIDDTTFLYPAFGDNRRRLDWILHILGNGGCIPTLVHPSAYVSPKAIVKMGTAILPNAIINTGCEVECGCIINCGAIVDHDCILEEGVHICLGAIVKAENRIPKCMKIEAGEVVKNRTYPL